MYDLAKMRQAEGLLSLPPLSIKVLLLLLGALFALALVLGFQNTRQRFQLGRSNELIGSALPRLEQRWYLLGIDTLIQNIADLRDHKSSLRPFERHQTHGRTYVSTVLGQSTIHTIDPVNILTMTTHSSDSWGRGDWVKIIARYMGNGILVNDGQAWLASRTMLKPLFRRNKAADVRLFERHVDRWIPYLQTKGTFVDFRRAAQMVVLDITIDMLCGKSSSSIPGFSKPVPLDQSKKLLDLIDELEPYGNIAIELGPLSIPIYVWRYRTIMGLVKGIQGFFRTAVEETIHNHSSSSEQPLKEAKIIQQMLAEGLAPNEVQGELQNIFFAAFDTTTALITNLFDCVARVAEIQDRLRAEIRRETGRSGTLDETIIPRLVYLRAAIFETLRLHSPVTSHTRKARMDTFLPRGGTDTDDRLFIPKGTSVVWTTYVLNRMIGVCNDNDFAEFRPDRWLEEGETIDVPKLKSDSNFMPFGSGPRNCLGQQFALQLTTYVAARLLTTFEKMELQDPERPFQEAAAVTYYNGHTTRIKFGP